LQLHTSPINHFRIPAGAPHLVVTGSYDGSVRSLDVNAGISFELFRDADGGVSSLDIDEASSEGVTLWLGTYLGAVMHLDSRVPLASAHAFEPYERKVTALSCLHGTPYFVTACTSGTVSVWDTRKMPAGARASPKPVVELDHGLSVTSACFSSHGRRLVTTSNDNFIRVFDVSGSGVSASVASLPVSKIRHDNHTGRWLTPFKSVWDPANDDVIVVGEMGTHHVQVRHYWSEDKRSSIFGPNFLKRAC
jgi:WD repeat-containing protein 76